MMEMNGLTSAALAVPIVAAASIPKENGHGHALIHHQVETDPLVVSMKLAAGDPGVQVHLNHQENGVPSDMVNNVVVSNSVLSVNPNAAAVCGLVAQQLKPPTAVVATATSDGGGGGGLLAVVSTKETETTGTSTTINPGVSVGSSISVGSSTSVATSGNTTSSSGGGGYESKLFVGGLSWQTSSEKLREYFSKFGTVLEVQVVVDPMTQRSRGFGFITFADADTVRKIVSVPNHILDGKRIDPKHATPRNKQVPTVNSYKTKKIFVGGVSQDTTLDEIKAYFSQFGKVEDAVMLMDQQTMRHRGFGFVTFESDEVVERICEIHYHTIKDKKVECKKAKPKEAQTMAVTGLHAFNDHAAAAAAAHHLQLATSAASALGAQRTTPAAAAAYAAFYGGHLGLAGTPGGHPQQATITAGNLAAAGGLGIIPAGTAGTISAAPGGLTYSSIRSGLARYTPYPVRNWNGNAAAAAAASLSAAAVAPPPPPPSAAQMSAGPPTILTSLSAAPSPVQAAAAVAASPFGVYHHHSLAQSQAQANANTATALDFGLPGISTAVAAPSMHPAAAAATFDWSGVYHV